MRLGSTVNHEGTVTTFKPHNKILLHLSSGNHGGGHLGVHNNLGEQVAKMTVNPGAGCLVGVSSSAHEGNIVLGTYEHGGLLSVSNKTGKPIVTMAADEYGNGTVMVQRIDVTNGSLDAGKVVVGLGTDDAGHGLVYTGSAQDKLLVSLGATVSRGYGYVSTYSPEGKKLGGSGYDSKRRLRHGHDLPA